jgi:transcriptional regulator with XRE-family HTH domain
VTTILDQPSTTSAVVGSFVHADIALATGLLVDPDFGTNTGIAMARRLRSVAVVMTGVPGPPLTDLAGDDPAAEVRALRDRIAAQGLSKQEIARAIGVDRRSLSGYAKGDIRPSSRRLGLLHTLADLVEAISTERPGRVRDLLLSRRGRVALVDQLGTAGRSILRTWPAWVARTEATVTVTPRVALAEPVWAAAARAVAGGRLGVPRRAHTVRPESTYEMDLDEAMAFSEPEYKSRRRDYR